jgi:hypothetical protein
MAMSHARHKGLNQRGGILTETDTDSADRAARAGRLVWVAGCTALLVFYLYNLSIYFAFTADDPGITFRYGANLFDGRGLVFNPGERVEGYSNFGHVVLSGLVYKILALSGDGRWTLTLAIKLLNVLFGAAAGYYCYRYAADILGRRGLTGLVPVLLAAANGALIINIASPLETAAYAMLVTAMMYRMARYLLDPPDCSRRHLPLLALLGSLILLWRIDSPALFAAFVAVLVLVRRFRLQRSDWLLLGLWGAIFLAYTGCRFLWFGDLLNNPYYTKVKHRIGLGTPFGTPYVAEFFKFLGIPALVFLAAMAVVAWRTPRRHALPVALIVAQWLYILLVNGDWMTGYRFWAVVVPPLCLVISEVIELPQGLLPPRWGSALRWTLALLIAGVWFVKAQEHYRREHQQPFAFYAMLGDFAPKHLCPYWATAEWLNRHADKDAVMAVQEAGFMPFLSGLTAIDTYGLCDRRLARLPGPRNRLGLKISWDPAEPGVQYILSRRPDLIVVGPHLDWADAPPRFLGDYLLAATPEAGINIFRREDSTRVR